MDGVEKAIRAALEKGDAEDRGHRERVYGQAFAALERATGANPSYSPEMVAARKAALQRTIDLIESEFAPALGGMSRDPRGTAAPEVSVGSPARPAASKGPAAARGPAASRDSRADPVFSGTDAHAPLPDFEREPVEDSGAAPELGSGHGPVATRPRRRRVAKLLVAVTVLAGLSIGLWWAYGTGLLGGRVDGSVPNPPRIAEEEEFTPPAGDSQAPRPPEQADAEAAWIGIFSPSDPATVSAPGGGTAEVREQEGESFMRIRSGNGSAIRFDIGQGVLEQLAGRRAVFSILARAEGDTPLQMSVECDFGALGDCGRRRYDVGTQRGEYLFDLDVPRAAPNGPGSIAVSTGLGGQPRSLDVFEVRVSVTQ